MLPRFATRCSLLRHYFVVIPGYRINEVDLLIRTFPSASTLTVIPPTTRIFSDTGADSSTIVKTENECIINEHKNVSNIHI